eukprot:Awhi_evm1s14510
MSNDFKPFNWMLTNNAILPDAFLSSKSSDSLGSLGKNTNCDNNNKYNNPNIDSNNNDMNNYKNVKFSEITDKNVKFNEIIDVLFTEGYGNSCKSNNYNLKESHPDLQLQDENTNTINSSINENENNDYNNFDHYINDKGISKNECTKEKNAAAYFASLGYTNSPSITPPLAYVNDYNNGDIKNHINLNNNSNTNYSNNDIYNNSHDTSNYSYNNNNGYNTTTNDNYNINIERSYRTNNFSNSNNSSHHQYATQHQYANYYVQSSNQQQQPTTDQQKKTKPSAKHRRQIIKLESKKKECSHCKSDQTSLWRYNEKAEKVCNACWLYEKKYKKQRPLTLNSRIVTRRLSRRATFSSNKKETPSTAGAETVHSSIVKSNSLNNIVNMHNSSLLNFTDQISQQQLPQSQPQLNTHQPLQQPNSQPQLQSQQRQHHKPLENDSFSTDCNGLSNSNTSIGPQTKNIKPRPKRQQRRCSQPFIDLDFLMDVNAKMDLQQRKRSMSNPPPLYQYSTESLNAKSLNASAISSTSSISAMSHDNYSYNNEFLHEELIRQINSGENFLHNNNDINNNSNKPIMKTEHCPYNTYNQNGNNNTQLLRSDIGKGHLKTIRNMNSFC